MEEQLTIAELVEECHNHAFTFGFWNDEDGELNICSDLIPEKLMLIVTELAEAMEAYRDSYEADLLKILYHSRKPDGFVVELADTLIRIFDLCGAFNLPIEAALRTKMDYNKTRGYRHGGKRC